MPSAASICIVWTATALVLAATGVAGCASPPREATINSEVNLAGAAPIQRVLVIANVDFNEFYQQMADAFREALANRFTLCGVQSQITVSDPLAKDPKGSLASALQESKATAVLEIDRVPGGGSGVLNGRGQLNGLLVFQMKLLDIASQKLMWQARASVNMTGMVDDRVPTGVGFATMIASRMRGDGVLRDCPAVWPKFTGCEERRRDALNDVGRARDNNERARLLEAVPSCSSPTPGP